MQFWNCIQREAILKTQDGTILAWRLGETTNCFEPAASLKGHNLAVVSLVIGASRLYSGSVDATIRIWGLEKLECIQTLTEHTDVVMSVLYWDAYLLSCSLDKTIKVWATAESANLEVVYTHKEEHGVLSLCGIHDQKTSLYYCAHATIMSFVFMILPSFIERGKIYSKEEVRAMEVRPGGLFFTGDGAGELRVWKMSEATSPASSPNTCSCD